MFAGNNSILDPKTLVNRQTNCPSPAMQFLAAGHEIRIGFLSNAEQIQMYSEDWIEEI
jgi:hypothetical protein